MKQTLLRLILTVLFFLLFAFVVKYELQFDLLAAFVCTYIAEGAVSEQLNRP